MAGRRGGKIGKGASCKGRRGVYNWYAGELFRSLTESAWARAFDARGIRWSYEPSRFVCESCSYLPDFWLPGLGAYAEVKPRYPDFRAVMLAKLLHLWDGAPVYFLCDRPERGHCHKLYTKAVVGGRPFVTVEPVPHIAPI